MKKISVIRFPGSNCDKDIGSVLSERWGFHVRYLWHQEEFQDMPDLVVLPGGFSYGDYLRSGAMAKFSRSMASLQNYVKKGGFVLGVCNGFQILTEAGLLPGALLPNRTLRYVCKEVELFPEPNNDLFGNLKGRTLKIPIAHGDGAFFADPETLDRLQDQGQILFRYKENPNGSLLGIAGVQNDSGRVLGMMPHPERALNSYTGNEDGVWIFETIFSKIS